MPPKRLQDVAHVSAGVGVGRIEPQRALVVRQRLVEPVQPLQHHGANLPRRPVIRVKLRASAQIQKSFIQVSQLTEEMPGLVSRVGMVGIELERAPKAQKCLVRTPAFDQTSSQASPEACVIRLELYRLVEHPQRVVVAAQLQQSRTQSCQK